MYWSLLGILAVVAAVLCAVGFYKYVYFMSIGYGFAVAGIGIAIIVLFIGKLTVAEYLLCALLIIYGIRLSGFLLYRELKNASYRKTLGEVSKQDKPMPIFVKIAIWLSVTVLYVGQTTPVLYRAANKTADDAAAFIGIAVCVIAIIIESLADSQKSAQKKVNPDIVATKGLYKIVRCPNYFGEILFWTGIFVSSVTSLNFYGQWLVAIIAYISIIGVMISGAQRLEKRQIKRYGDNIEYKEYSKKTPILIPLIPIYHLVKQNKD